MARMRTGPEIQLGTILGIHDVAETAGLEHDPDVLGEGVALVVGNGVIGDFGVLGQEEGTVGFDG